MPEVEVHDVAFECRTGIVTHRVVTPGLLGVREAEKIEH
jgi:hypothetical protein